MAAERGTITHNHCEYVSKPPISWHVKPQTNATAIEPEVMAWNVVLQPSQNGLSKRLWKTPQVLAGQAVVMPED